MPNPTGPILCVGALTMDTIFRLDRLPDGPGKVIPLDAVEVAEGMAAAQAASIARLGGTPRFGRRPAMTGSAIASSPRFRPKASIAPASVASGEAVPASRRSSWTAPAQR